MMKIQRTKIMQIAVVEKRKTAIRIKKNRIHF